jgi:heterodisulfide reductase subunit D
MSEPLHIPTLAELTQRGEKPDVLFWVGCAGSYDDRAKRITKSFARLLHRSGVSFAILGAEEGCTGDPARRAGNEFLYQMQALANIEVLNAYEVQRIVTTCPHCFNTLKNEYPELGGSYEVYHHTQYLQTLLQEGKLKVEGGAFKGKRVVFHDPCYLGRVNKEYEAPREVLGQLEADLIELKRCKKNGLCCGAGGAQMFKEPEKGNKDINHERAEEALQAEPAVIATGCPFCNTMLTDGVKHFEKEGSVKVLDIAEALDQSHGA